MQIKFIEANNGPLNWGKFLVGRFAAEDWSYRAREIAEGDVSLLRAVGWGRHNLLVHDLQTGEGAIFSPSGLAQADLEKHRIWVCPLFEPFLTWLYQQDLTDLAALPDTVTFTTEEAPFALRGYRRAGAPERLIEVTDDVRAALRGVGGAMPKVPPAGPRSILDALLLMAAIQAADTEMHDAVFADRALAAINTVKKGR